MLIKLKMKNITKSMVALLAIFTLGCSSDDVEDRPVVQGIDSPLLIAPESNNVYTLLLEDAALQADRFVWTPAKFSENIEITYTVEIDNAGGDFSAPESVGSVNNSTQLSVSVGALNTAVAALGAVPFEASTYDVRIKASTASSTAESMYSQKMTITVISYVAMDPVLFLVGAPQGFYGLNEWDNTTAIPMRYIGDGMTKVFEAYVKVASDQGFKFIGEQGTWDNGNYGTIGGAQDGNLENSGGSGDIKIAEGSGSGLYYIQVDMDALKYKAVKMDWGIIGAATAGGWDNETPMIYDFATNTYNITATLSAGEMKFRSSNTSQFIFGSGESWKFNVGNSDPKFAYDTNAPNFNVSAGSKTIGLTIGFDGTATVSGL